jgi:hypothetical protein
MATFAARVIEVATLRIRRKGRLTWARRTIRTPSGKR